MEFPAMKANDLLALLRRKPLNYVEMRVRGSHRLLESKSGYPPLIFAWHSTKTIPPGMVRKILIKDVGLSPEEIRALL